MMMSETPNHHFNESVSPKRSWPIKPYKGREKNIPVGWIEDDKFEVILHIGVGLCRSNSELIILYTMMRRHMCIIFVVTGSGKACV